MPGLEGLVGDQVRKRRLISLGNFVWLRVVFNKYYFRVDAWAERFLTKAV